MSWSSDWYAVIKTLQEMLNDRGYTRIQAINKHGDGYVMLCVAQKPGGAVLCFLSLDAKTGVKTIRAVEAELLRHGTSHAILISRDGCTSFSMKEMNDSRTTIETFKKTDLSFNVSKHVLVPAHRALSPDEKRELLSRLRLKAGDLPRMKASDPVARYYNFTPGTVVRIERQVANLEPGVYYRTVV